MAYRYDTYCGACHALRAAEEGRVEEQAKEWGRDPEEVRCHGCGSNVLSSRDEERESERRENQGGS